MKQEGVDGAQVVAFAQQQLGDAYDFGATGPDRWDCSALVQWAYKQAGIQLPRVTHDQVNAPAMEVITADELRPGDLIYSDWANLGPNSHVAIYAGELGTKATGGLSGPVTIEARGSSATGKPGVSYRAFDQNARNHATAYRRVKGTKGSGAGTPASNIGLPGVPGVPGSIIDAAATIGNILGSSALDPLGALNRIGDGIAAGAKTMLNVGELAGFGVNIALHPQRYIIKGFLFFFGVIFILIGIWNLTAAFRKG